MIALWAGLAVAAPALTGTDFAEVAAPLDPRERQQVAVEHLMGGVVPTFLGDLATLCYEAADAEGTVHVVEIEVLRDYLAIGTDGDYLPIALDLPAAREVARAWQMVLPTPKLVDAIYEAADERVAPRPLPPGPEMRSVAYLLRHRELLREQGAGSPPDGVRAGHKKDVVLTRRLFERPDRVAIYGWHRSEGEPIQDLSLWHGDRYVDYSHGVRLVSATVRVDDQPWDLFDLLADEVLAPLVSDEGPIPGARALLWEAS